MALAPLHSLMRGLREVRKGLPLVTAPALVIHAVNDQVAHIGNAREIHQRIGSTRKRLEMMRIKEGVTSRHVLTTHRETRDRVAELVVEFVRQVLGGEPDGSAGDRLA